ncbi:carboxypeptidase-like regulatory domain-containing protein [Fodinibius salsisoli]|uniref:Carboxypeptidase-like regulatory domain-containing protein n=1 Tax=Fodinibius salsisoli TaxID=2820877 RepID=A0ABT3PK52_9BACT|nr:carboxypeptidase-like regulatory domain-containing protein [Fodinibius salsisoli]MCW9706292.1 carboxypeptidase-like regulatory domain-containing protein [Fodinibius salsisoli]
MSDRITIYSKIALIFLFALLPGWQSVYAQTESTTTVEGSVTDSKGKLLPGVNVALPQLNRGTSTKTDGSYIIRGLPSGTYMLVFSFIGYQSTNREVRLQKGKTMTLNLSLQKAFISSESVTVTGTPYASDPLTTPADVDVIAGDTKFAQQKTSLGGSLDWWFA